MNLLGGSGSDLPNIVVRLVALRRALAADRNFMYKKHYLKKREGTLYGGLGCF
jgi:hypothetical protein